MRLGEFNTGQWKRVCDVASLLLDAPAADGEAILARECGDNQGLREAVLHVCRDFSDSDDLFGAPPLRVPDDPRIGQRIGAWRILRLIGEGGMGKVYLVERDDDVFAKRAALKLIRGYCDPHAAERFRNERRILALLDHEAIARALDGGATGDGVPYLVMEYVDGVPIDEYCLKLPIRERIRLFLQVVDAIEVAHHNLIVHRDLKPSNILVAVDGQAKILDFGIAKLLEDDHAESHTRAPAATPSYASPEQLLAEPVATFSDIYSLGAVLYKLLTGNPPHDFSGRNALQSIQAVTETAPLRPSRHVRELAGDLDCILLKALDRNPRRRYASAAEFGLDLRRHLEGRAVKARPATPAYRIGRWLRRNRVVAIASAAILTAVAAGVLSTVREKHRAERRFEEGRRLAHSVMFDYEIQLGHLAGSTRLREKIATDTVRYLDGIFADAASDPELQREIAAAYRQVGEIQGYSRAPNLGKLTAALSSLRKSVDLWRTVAGRGGGRPGDRLELATSLERLASVESDTGGLAQAESLANESIGILNHLPDTATDGAALHRELAAAYLTASRLEQRRGEGMKAIDLARRGLQEAERLPPNPLDPQGITASIIQLATCDDDYGLADPRLTREGIDLARKAVKLVHDAPPCSEFSCRETAAMVLTRASVVLGESGLVNEAMELPSAVEMVEQLLREDPGNLRILSSLRSAVQNKGVLLGETGNVQEALKSGYRLIEVTQAIADSDPAQPELRLNAAGALTIAASQLIDLKRFGEAQTYLDRAAVISDSAKSDNVDWLISRHEIHHLKAQVEEHAGDLVAERRELEESLAAAKTYVSRAPRHPYAIMLQANSNYRLGSALRPSDPLEACSALRSAADGYRQLIAMGRPIERQWKDNAQRTDAALPACSVILR